MASTAETPRDRDARPGTAPRPLLRVQSFLAPWGSLRESEMWISE